MKEIQGKIKFGVINVSHSIVLKEETKHCSTEDFLSISDEQMVGSVFLSEATEEQAAEFVEGYGIMYKYYGENSKERLLCTAKESLISLLKANDVWIKEWKENPKYEDYNGHAYCADFITDTVSYEQLPDDLLLIKLQ